MAREVGGEADVVIGQPEDRAATGRVLLGLHSLNAVAFLVLAGTGCLWSAFPAPVIGIGVFALWGSLLWEHLLSRRWMSGHDGPTPRGIRSMGLTRAIIAIGSVVVAGLAVTRLAGG